MNLAAETKAPAISVPPGTSKAPEPLAYDVATAARIMGVSKSTIFNELKAGRITAKKLGRKTLLTRAAIDAWLANLPTRTAA